MLNEPGSENQDNQRRHPLLDYAEKQERLAQERKQPPQGQVLLRMPVVRPRAVWVLIGINVLIYVIAVYVLPIQQLEELYQWGANSHTAVLKQGEYHRLLSAMFLHSPITPAHIIFNMYALYAIGITIERFFGHARFLWIYFLGGLAGSITSVVLNPPSITSVGASGAVFAIFGAEMVFLYKHRKLFGKMAQNQLMQLVVVAVLNFGVGIATALSSDAQIRIDNWGHIGGFIGGVVLAWFITPILLPKRHPTQANALTIEDVNPLEKHTQVLLAFASVLLGLLLIGTFLARGGL